MIFKKIYEFGDRLEDKVRGKLSHYPIIYAFVGGAGIIIFWRGVWVTVDYIMESIFAIETSPTGIGALTLHWWDGPLSIIVGTAILLLVGLFVTSFIGNEIIISGLKREKKIVEKTEDEIAVESKESIKIKIELQEMANRLKRIEDLLKK